MKNGTKYFSVLMVLMFIAGQIQYGYTTYFCTMLNQFLPSAEAVLAVHQEADTCGQCDGMFAAQSGSKTFEPNCFRIDTVQKDVLSTFTSSNNPDFFCVTTVALIITQPSFQQATLRSWSVAPSAPSPPLDLPTFNSNLRI